MNTFVQEKAALAAFFVRGHYGQAGGLALFIFSWLIYDHYRPWTSFHSEAVAIAATLLLGWSCLLARCNRIPSIVIWLAGVAFLPWLQWGLGLIFFAGDALMASMYLSVLLCAIYIGYSFTSVAASGNVPAYFHGVWIAGLISGAIGIFQWLGLQESWGMYIVQTGPGDRAMGNVGQPNHLATLLLMSGPALLAIYEFRVFGRFTTWLLIGFLTLALVLTQSRSGMVGAVITAAFFAWKSPRLKFISKTGVIVWLAIFFCATATLPHIASALLMDGGVRSLSFSDNVRLLMWSQVWHGILQQPWTGFGWNQTPTAHMAGALDVPGWGGTFSYSHSLILDLMAWNGIPIALLLTVGLAYWFISRMLEAKDVQSICAMAALLPLMAHSVFEYPFAYSYFLLAGGLFAGLVEAKYSNQSILFSRKIGCAFLVGWAMIGGYASYEYLKIEEDFRIVRFESLRVGKPPPDYAAPSIWMLSHMGEMLQAARTVVKPAMKSEDIERLRKTSARFSYSSLMQAYAHTLALNNAPAAAIHQMNLIRSVYGSYYSTLAQEEFKEKYGKEFPLPP